MGKLPEGAGHAVPIVVAVIGVAANDGEQHILSCHSLEGGKAPRTGGGPKSEVPSPLFLFFGFLVDDAFEHGSGPGPDVAVAARPSPLIALVVQYALLSTLAQSPRLLRLLWC